MSLYKQWFQFSRKASFTVALGLAFADAFIPMAAPPDKGWVIALISCSTIFIGAFMMRKETRCKMLILYIIQVFVYNILGAAMIAVMTACYGLLTGKSSQTWFVDTTMTQTDHFMKWIGMVLSYCAAPKYEGKDKRPDKKKWEEFIEQTDVCEFLIAQAINIVEVRNIFCRGSVYKRFM